MGNLILNYGVVTPYVRFNFAAGTIEATMKPKYFVSLSHNRTCKQACTFKLTIVYVPDTFVVGQPTLIDNMLVSSKNQRVTYQYGYYDYLGVCHPQYCQYVGQMNKYNCDVDVQSGTLTYTVEGNAVMVELLNNPVSLPKPDPEKKLAPSEVLEIASEPEDTEEHPFHLIGENYHRHIDHSDEKDAQLPEFKQMGMLDIIMGTAQGINDSNGIPVKKGGIVSYSRIRLYDDVQDAYNAGYLTYEEYTNFRQASQAMQYGNLDTTGDLYKYWSQLFTEIRSKLYYPFICFFDDVTNLENKYGTFYYVPNYGNIASDTFIYRLGNSRPTHGTANAQQDYDVLSASFSYDGSVALANAPASKAVMADIDEEGNNIGHSNATTEVLCLGRNTYPTLSGFREDKFLSQQELAKYMLYPLKGSITIMGQIRPSNILDTITLYILINGAVHPTLSGEYTVLGITDNLDSQGFTTTLELARNTESGVVFEPYVTNSISGRAAALQNNIDNNTR